MGYLLTCSHFVYRYFFYLYSLCPGGGVGAGAGGRPGMPGENCEPLGNVLILQESDTEQPDDNAGGGILCFIFESSTTFLSMGLLDIVNDERGDFIEVTTIPQGDLPRRFDIDGLGSNAVQTVDINMENVERVRNNKCYIIRIFY